MAKSQIQPERIQHLNIEQPAARKFVLYWMQQSQRADFNHALEYAIGRANELSQPLVVAFGLMDDYPQANLRHYQFMLEGLAETRQALKDRGILMVVRHGRPDDVALELAQDASLVVADRGYLRHQKLWRQRVARQAGIEVVQVESDVVVPVDLTSDKAEYAARTIRPKIHRRLRRFLTPLPATAIKTDSLGLRLKGLDVGSPQSALARMKIDRSVKPVAMFKGGTSQAREILRHFIDDLLDEYAVNRNRPETDNVSHMSKYLHFGQISPVYVALEVKKAKRNRQAKAAFLEELIVRRELAQNFVNFVQDYDAFSCLPGWARATLKKHSRDRREHVYTPRQLDEAATHDEYWNAAMKEMKHTGYMHNYMRMYWGKKILEWSPNPRKAFDTALELNNKYFIDGRDANSFAGVAWIFGMHDRPWKERPIFGTVRYMSASGLQRKADPAAYAAKVNRQIESLR